MAPYEGIIFWLSLVLYTLATGLYLFSLVFGKKGAEKLGLWTVTVGFLLHSTAILIRWVATGHIPTIGNYENANFSAWGIMLFTIVFSFRSPGLRIVGLFSTPAAMFTMGFGVMSSPTLSPMVASLKSWWLYIHIIFAMLAYSAFFVAMAAAILYLVKERAEKAGKVASPDSAENPWIRRLPPLNEVDEIILKNVIYGFIAYAAMIGSGALWGKNLWGSYWRWDPVETWSLISWMIYGVILHLRITLGWRGARFCWLVIIAVPSVLLVFWGVNFAVESSLHIFNVR